MNITIRKIGNSEGVIIPKETLDRLGLKAGDTINMTEDKGGLYMKPWQVCCRIALVYYRQLPFH